MTTTSEAPARSGRRPWVGDPCPPEPVVLAGELCLPTGAPAAGARHVLADVLVVAPEVTAAHRATALSLLLPHRHGVVVRASAAWVWTGDATLRPTRVDLAVPAGAPEVPGPRPGAHRSLPVRRTRWTPGTGWATLTGLAVTDPVTTAAECVRLLPAPVARRCLSALLRQAGVALDDVERALRDGARQGPRPPGTAEALVLVGSVRTAASDGVDPAAHRTGVRTRASG